MAEEKVTPTEKVGDAELSDAWDVAVGDKEEVKEEEKVDEKEAVDSEVQGNGKPAPEETQASQDSGEEDEEPTDHKERSKLGRKLKGLNERIEQLTAIIERLQQPKAESTDESEIQMPEVISTPEDIDKYLTAKEQKARKAKAQYEGNYLRQIAELKTENSDMHEEIFAEMLANFNKKYSDNAFADARVNYAEAKSSVLSKKYSGGTKVPSRDKADKAPVQPAASASRTSAKGPSLPKLDAEAESFVRYLRNKGYSEEQIAKELA